jgi:hypothetical protein
MYDLFGPNYYIWLAFFVILYAMTLYVYFFPTATGFMEGFSQKQARKITHTM